MPVVGAVLTLTPHAPTPAALSSDPRITVGERAGAQLPIVIETTRRKEDRELLETLERMPDVLQVAVAFADFSDLLEVSP